MVKILVVCSNPDILRIILRLTNSNKDWKATGTSTVQEAKNTLTTDNFNLLLIGSGLTDGDEHGLIEHVKNSYSAMRIVQHYGGGSGLLSAEIYQALK